MRLYIFEVMNI